MKRILVCAAGGSPAVNFIRSVRLMKEPVFLLGVDCDPYTLARAETDARALVPRASEPDYISILNQLIAEHQIDFIHIQNDTEVEVISKNRDKINAKTFLPSQATIDICLDKFASYERWEKAGLTVPKTMLLNSEADLRKAYDTFGPELWLRDIKGAAGKGAYPTNEYEEALAWVTMKKGWGHFTAAERLTKDSITWMSIWKDGELVVAQSRKRLYWELGDRSPAGVTGVTGAGATFSDPAFDALALKAIAAIDAKPDGIFSVDMTIDKKGLPNPTEINIGRFFTTHFFFSKAGLNMPEIFVKLAFGEPVEPLAKKVNPLLDGLVWIRGVDFEPVLTTLGEVEKSKKELADRRAAH